MKLILRIGVFVILGIVITGALQSNIFDDIGDFFTKTIPATATTAYEKGIKPAATTVYEEALKPVGMGAASIVAGVALDVANAFTSLESPRQVYCYNPNQNPQPPAIGPTVHNPTIRAQDTEGIIPLAIAYAPELILHPNEPVRPITVEELYTGAYSGFMDRSGKPQTDQSKHTVAIPRGQVTMQKIDAISKKGGDYYVDIAQCVQWGSNPFYWTNAQGHLTMPAYLLTFNENGKLYFQYLFLYGLNAPYDIRKLIGVVKSEAEALDIANFHEVDLEHVTLEIDPATKKILRIYFGSHGSKEGMWLPANSPDIQWNGTHFKAYVARGGHGLYPRPGTYVRIFGLANDQTGEGLHWDTWTNLTRIYTQNDPRTTINHSYMFFPNQQGQGLHGVGTFGAQFRGNTSGDQGRPYSSVPFCPASNNPLEAVAEDLCIRAKSTTALPPD